MDSPTALLIVRWQAYAALRQALASKLFWIMAGAIGLCVLLCLSVRVHGPAPLPLGPGEHRERLPVEDYRSRPYEQVKGLDVAASEVTFLFGAIRVPYRHYTDDAVGFLQLLLAGFVADTAGVLLALIWTAGFLPAFLEPGVATLCLAKPVPRWGLLVGTYLGVVSVVTLQIITFVLGTWLALGLSTGVWASYYLLSIPIVLLHFAIFFSVSTLLAVLTRNTILSMLGALGFWGFCWAINHAWHSAQTAAMAGAGSAAGPGTSLLDAAYWTLPKPADLNWLLFQALKAQDYFGTLLDYRVLEGEGLWHIGLSLTTSLAFTVALLALSVFRFAKTDY